METQKGSKSFRMHLSRVSVDGDDQPIVREATLCLRTQQAQTTVPNILHRLMDIYIDGDLMACWNLTLLKHHLSYQSIHVFSSFSPSKHINMILPLPLDTPATPQKNGDDLKVIRIYFNKTEGFHTAISWLSKKAEMVHQDGRPATTLGFHSTSSAIRELPASLGVQQPMAPPAQPSASQPREESPSRLQSCGEDVPTPQQSGHSQSELLGSGGQSSASQYLQRPRSRRHVAHGILTQRRQSDLRRNLLSLQETDRSSMPSPSMRAYRNGHQGLGGLQMPRNGSMPARAMSAAPMGSRPPPRYNRPADAGFRASLPTALGTLPGRHSPQYLHGHSRGAHSSDSFQEAHIQGDQYLSRTNLGPDRDATIRLLRSKALDSIPNQIPIDDKSMGVDVAVWHGGVLGYASRKRRVMSVTPIEASVAETSQDRLNADWRSNASSQPIRMPTFPRTLSRPSLDNSEVPSPKLSAVTTATSQERPNEDPRFTDASHVREPGQFQELQTSHKRPPSAQALQQTREKKRKANQPMKRASRQASRDNGADGQAYTASNGTQTETAEAAQLALSLDYKSPPTTVCAIKDIKLVDCAIQTDPSPTLQADVLHLSAALKLHSSLLLETKRWDTIEDLEKGLLGLSTKFVQGLYDVCKST